jgi:hypothetical protein
MASHPQGQRLDAGEDQEGGRRKGMFMAGLYDGLEEVAFKRISGGYLFVSNNPWLIGTRRRYFVNEAQKAEIAECLRQTMRRIIICAVLIPLVLVAAVLWLAFSGCTLSVTTVGATGESSTYTQPIAPTGSTGTLAGAAGATIIFKVSRPPGKDATVTFTGVGPTGIASGPWVAQFGPAGSKIDFADASGNIVGSATLVGRTGATPGSIPLHAMLLTLGMFVPYIALMHAYSMRRLRSLIAGLPRSDERITLREGIEGFTDDSAGFSGVARFVHSYARDALPPLYRARYRRAPGIEEVNEQS